MPLCVVLALQKRLTMNYQSFPRSISSGLVISVNYLALVPPIV